VTAKPETILKIDRGPRGELHITLAHTPEGAAYVELAHVQPNGALSRGSTIKPTELSALITALTTLDVRLRHQAQRDRRPGSVARELAEAKRDMEAF
jgi:hypothetical protein